MPDTQAQKAAHFTIFRSARDELPSGSAERHLLTSPVPDVAALNATNAAYFSRRAREELQAAIHGTSRKARKAHFELAQTYELRAHLLTEQSIRRDAADNCYAL